MSEITPQNDLNDVVNEVVKEKPSATDNLEDLVTKTADKFIERQLYRFPYYCYEARKANIIKRKMFEDSGNPGGWSASKDFKFDYEIPRDLYLFMSNLVYKNFWADSNEKVWRSFMKAVMRGDDPMTLLMKVKTYYGSNADKSLVS